MERIGEEISQYGILGGVERKPGISELPAFCTDDGGSSLWIRGRAGQYADHADGEESQNVYGGERGGRVAGGVSGGDPVFCDGSWEKPAETVAVKRRSWIGIPGKIKGRRDLLRIAMADEQTEMVYVGCRNGEISPVPGLPLYFQ